MSPELEPVREPVRPMVWPSLGPDGAPPADRDVPVDAGELSWLLSAGDNPILPSLAERIEAARRDGHERGLVEGQELVAREAEDRCQAFFGRVERTLAELEDLRVRVMHEAERDLIRLALAMAARLVHREIEADPTRLLEIARQAIDRLGEAVPATVRLHPAECASAAAAVEREASITLVADPTLPPGGCLIEAATGQVDAGLDAQIRVLTDDLLGPVVRPDPDAGDARG